MAETQPEYVVALSVPTRDGRIDVAYGDLPASEGEVAALADALAQAIARQGGVAWLGKNAEDDQPQTPDW